MENKEKEINKKKVESTLSQKKDQEEHKESVVSDTTLAHSDTVSKIVETSRIETVSKIVETSRNATSLNDMPQHDRIAEVREYVLPRQPVSINALLDHFEPDAFIYDLIQRGLLVRVPSKDPGFENYEWMRG